MPCLEEDLDCYHGGNSFSRVLQMGCWSLAVGGYISLLLLS